MRTKFLLIIFILLVFVSSCASVRTVVPENKKVSLFKPRALLLVPFHNHSLHPKAGLKVVEALGTELRKCGVVVRMAALDDPILPSTERDELLKLLSAARFRYALAGDVIEYGFAGPRAVVSFSLRIYDSKTRDYVWGDNFAASGKDIPVRGRIGPDEVLNRVAVSVARLLGRCKVEKR